MTVCDRMEIHASLFSLDRSIRSREVLPSRSMPLVNAAVDLVEGCRVPPFISFSSLCGDQGQVVRSVVRERRRKMSCLRRRSSAVEGCLCIDRDSIKSDDLGSLMLIIMTLVNHHISHTIFVPKIS
ncbi:hypothetical protein L2E82_11604 [Cichorium intybus]|uniref:Uncharacterized protein n=1 Tax=Cichorium intybus TaxID=13427 RepID=A0ACB9GF03_CICIN|nr:hypothetical protein L2E82_11604 [Cichorium intybus]